MAIFCFLFVERKGIIFEMELKEKVVRFEGNF